MFDIAKFLNLLLKNMQRLLRMRLGDRSWACFFNNSAVCLKEACNFIGPIRYQRS